MKPTLGSLFAGIGGIDLGFERAGFETVWQVEQNEFCRKVLAKNFPKADRSVTDVRNGSSSTLSRVDVLAGGFPCQDISVAGRGEGIAGARSGLWKEFARIIGDLRPQYVLVENVELLLRRGLATVLGDLTEIGYDAEWEPISAAQAGLPQPRKRLWVLAYPSSHRKQRLLQSKDISSLGQGWARGTENLQIISDFALLGSSRFPKPLLCGVDGRVPSRMDRIHALGNSVVPQIPEWIAGQILKDMNNPENGQGVVGGS